MPALRHALLLTMASTVCANAHAAESNAEELQLTLESSVWHLDQGKRTASSNVRNQTSQAHRSNAAIFDSRPNIEAMLKPEGAAQLIFDSHQGVMKMLSCNGSWAYSDNELSVVCGSAKFSAMLTTAPGNAGWYPVVDEDGFGPLFMSMLNCIAEAETLSPTIGERPPACPSTQSASDAAQVDKIRQLASGGNKRAQVRLVSMYAEGRIATSEDADLSSPEATLAGYIDSLRSGRASGVLERYEGRGFYVKKPVPIETYEIVEKITFGEKEVKEWPGKPRPMLGDVELQVRQTEDEMQYTTSFWMRDIAGAWKIFAHAQWDSGEFIDEDIDAEPTNAIAVTPDTSDRNKVPITTADKEFARLYRDLQSALGSKGYTVGPPIAGITPNRDFVASLSQFIEEHSLEGMEGAAEALNVPFYTACFWLDDQLKCPLGCSASIKARSSGGLMSVQGFSVDCPGYERTFVPLP